MYQTYKKYTRQTSTMPAIVIDVGVVFTCFIYIRKGVVLRMVLAVNRADTCHN